jgi:hypothetical protein
MDELFAQPDPDHMPAVYWFWHKQPTAREIRAQVADMDAGGFRSFQIQARLAYPMAEYLNDDYLKACRLAVEEAAARQMTVGIYDEYNWQSGHAGGRTVSGADHLRERHLFWSRARLGTGAAGPVRCEVSQITSSTESLGVPGMEWHYEGGEVLWDDWALVAAVATPEHSPSPLAQLVDLSGAARLVEGGPDGCVVEVRPGPHCPAPTDITVFVAARCATSRLPNYLLEESARRFVEVGYEPFAAALGDFFGTTVKYLFFDQPHANIYSWAQHFGNLRCSLPYADEMRSFVQSRTDIGFATLLVALLDDVGETTAALRSGFYDSYAEFACQAYLGVLAPWAKRRGVALSGHEVLGHVGSWHPGKAFGAWDLRANFGLDYFGVDGYRGITGVDAQDCVAQLSTKFGDSVARSHGRSGCVVEQYLAGRTSGRGAWAGNWGLTLEELRAQAFRLEILGARQFLYHGFYQTDGNGEDFTRYRNPRFDFPPGLNFEPWWPYHRAFADEAGRLSVFLDGADPACEVALFYPLRTAWAEGSGHSYGDHVEFWARYLAERGFGYHLVDERDLLPQNCQNGALHLGRRRYRCLVLPSVTTLRSGESLAAIERFASGGGLLVCSGQTPTHLQEGEGLDAEQYWANAIAGAKGYQYFASLPDRASADTLLLGLMEPRPHVRVADDGPPLWQWCGGDTGGWRLVVFNDTDVTRTVELRLPWDYSAMQRWWATSGEQTAWAALAESRSAHGRAELRLEAMELCCLRLRARLPEERLDHWALDGPTVAFGNGSDTELLDGWSLELPAGSGHEMPISVSAGWEAQGFPGVSGVGRYSRTVQLPAGARRVVLTLPEVHSAVEVRWNGACVARRGWSPYRFDLPEVRTRSGPNYLELLVASAAGNKYYSATPFDPGPEPSGLTSAPVLTVS